MGLIMGLYKKFNGLYLMLSIYYRNRSELYFVALPWFVLLRAWTFMVKIYPIINLFNIQHYLKLSKFIQIFPN